MKCRHCKSELSTVFIDLGSSPPSNAYLTTAQLNSPEKWYPLKVMVCPVCWLVQTQDYVGAEELFTDDYAYFSSYSSTWLAHARNYVNEVERRFTLNGNSMVVEIAANDGYLLQYVKQKGIPCLGVEPTKSTASAARQKGIDIIEEFFTQKLAKKLMKEGQSADLIVANNVLAHVPDINDFVSGISYLLKPGGAATFEFAYLVDLVSGNQFDTIYHEHYSYLSLTAVKNIFDNNGLSIFDVERLPTHGGSLRIFACRKDATFFKETENVSRLLTLEVKTGVTTVDYYRNFQERVNRVKNDFVAFLIKSVNEGKKTIGYGAAAKGNTLLNYAGVHKDLIPFVVDINPAKQGKYLPGSRIPIVTERYIKELHPDYVIIFPWNLKEEIMKQLNYIRTWGGKFVTAIPRLEIL